MGRDFTPRDIIAAEKYTGISFFDFMATTVMCVEGKEKQLYPAEEIALRKQFPLFGKLVNRFESLYDPLSKIEGGIRFLKEKEKELEIYLETEKGNLESYLVKWFNGELDPNFYYSEYNEELFVKEMLKEAREKTK